MVTRVVARVVARALTKMPKKLVVELPAVHFHFSMACLHHAIAQALIFTPSYVHASCTRRILQICIRLILMISIVVLFFFLVSIVLVRAVMAVGVSEILVLQASGCWARQVWASLVKPDDEFLKS